METLACLSGIPHAAARSDRVVPGVPPTRLAPAETKSLLSVERRAGRRAGRRAVLRAGRRAVLRAGQRADRRAGRRAVLRAGRRAGEDRANESPHVVMGESTIWAG